MLIHVRTNTQQHLAFMEMQIKVTWDIVTHPPEMLKIMTKGSVGKSKEQLKDSNTAGENVKWYNHFRNSLIDSDMVKHIFIWQ